MTWFLAGLGFALVAFSPMFPDWPLVALSGFGVIVVAATIKEHTR